MLDGVVFMCYNKCYGETFYYPLNPKVYDRIGYKKHSCEWYSYRCECKLCLYRHHLSDREYLTRDCEPPYFKLICDECDRRLDPCYKKRIFNRYLSDRREDKIEYFLPES